MAAAAPPPTSAERGASDAAAQQRVAFLSVIAAVFLVTVKLATGLVTGSLGLLAEAAHSGTDLVAALLTLFAVRIAVRPADEDHNYGHGKAEHLAALAESCFLMLVSVFLAFQAVDRLLSDTPHHVDDDLVVVPRARRRHRGRRLARRRQPAAPPAATTRPRSRRTRCTSPPTSAARSPSCSA